MKIEKIKTYIIGTKKGWINNNLSETENLENLKEFETFEEAKKYSNSLNEINEDYSKAGEINKVYIDNDFKGYFDIDWSDQDILQFLENAN